jgi:hypothetical protein
MEYEGTVQYLLCGERGRAQTRENLASGNRLSWQCTLHTADMVRGLHLSTSVSPPPSLYHSMLVTKIRSLRAAAVVKWRLGNKHSPLHKHPISVAANTK